ncbi:hypothetical protein ACW0FS_000680 [Vibrio vulnificus]
MSNNVKLISSIILESDFERLVKMYVQKIYDSKAYLVGGPWDNGKDLVLNIRGKEVREAIQISINEHKLESKVEEDLAKVVKLVDEHSYPPILNFYWSHPISEYTLDKLRTKAKKKYYITLEFYDAKRISQDITDNYPEILQFLFVDIHKYKFEFEEDINIQQRAFYEYLLLSKDSANLKNAIIDSTILSSLNSNSKNLDDIYSDLIGFNINRNSLNGKLQKLIKDNKLVLYNGLYNLSDNEKTKIENLKINQNNRKNEVIDLIRKELNQYTEKDLAPKVIGLITKAYEESANVQISESKFETPKSSIFKSTCHELKSLIHNECHLNKQETQELVERLMAVAAKNDYLSEHCTAKLCIGLLADRKLDKYIDSKMFYIYLDAPVLIPYILTLMFSDKKLFDRSMLNVDIMRTHINNLKNKRLRVTNEHFEETVRHLEQAGKLSRFVTKKMIEELGESKNVFFNVFMRWLDNQPERMKFKDFINIFIGLDIDDANSSGDMFGLYSAYIYDLLKHANFDLIDYSNFYDQSLFNRVKSKYVRDSKYSRANRSIENDLICAFALNDEKSHLDEAGYFSTPMIITLDTSQYHLRNAFQREVRHAEWLVYTPQRAIERLSLVGLKISPECLRDGVLASISEEYFFKENTTSLLDTLSTLLGEESASDGDVIKFVTQLKRNVAEELVDKTEIDIDKYNNISHVLLYIYREFREQFNDIVKIFNDDDMHDELSDSLLKAINGDFSDRDKSILNQSIVGFIGRNR